MCSVRPAAALTFVLAMSAIAAPVTASAQPASHVRLTRDALVFAVRGAARTPEQAVRLDHASPGPAITWKASASVPWLVVSPTGQSPSRVRISLGDVAALTDGEFTGDVHIVLGASERVFVIRVILQKNAAPGGPPIGHMDAPAEGHAVPGPVVFHGWAIDDVHVARVNLVSINDGRVLATAQFSDGGRPDIEQLRPLVPMQTRSAWSAVIDPVTMTAPRGLLTIAAIATDAEGRTAELGRRQITFLPTADPAGAERRLIIRVGATATAAVWLMVMVWSVSRARGAPVAVRPVPPSTGLWEVVAICVVVAGFVCLRPGWMARALSYDELYTASRFIVDVPLLRAATGVEVFNNHPLYSVVSWFTTSLLGSTEYVVRLPALVFGAIAVLATWRLTRRWFPVVPAIAAAGLLAAMPLFGEWSRSARGYSAAAAFSCLSVLWFIRTGQSGRPRDAFVHAVVTALAVYAHLYAVWVLAIELLAIGALALRDRSTPADRGVSAAAASCATAGLLIVATYWPMAADLFAVAEGRGRGVWSHTFGWELARGLTGMDTAAAVIAVAAFALVGVFAVWWRSRLGAVLLVGTLAAPVAVMWGVLRPFDLYPRFFVFWAPFLAILIAAGLSVLWRPRVTRVFAVAVVGWLGYLWLPQALTSPPGGDGYRAMVDRALIADAPVFSLGADVEMLSYYAGPMVALRSPVDIDVALTTAPAAVVLFHNVRWNVPEVKTMATRLSEQCHSTTRGSVVTFVCR